MEFNHKCTREFTAKWLDIIREFRAWIKEKLTK
jgi:hypothetical protein